MPKHYQKKDSEYLRFRPYRAFTAQPINPSKSDGWVVFWRVIIVLGALALLSFATFTLIKK